MLVYILAALLCCLYAADTIIISYCYRFFPANPSSSKLLLLAEGLKLFIATCLYLLEKEAPSTAAGVQCHQFLLSDSVECAHAHPHQQRQQRWQKAAKTLLVFSVPSMCYFATNNLSFYALTLMSAHMYTLLCDLKIISTGLLNYLVMDKGLSREAVMSLLVLFLGICIGQYATMRASAGNLSTIASTAQLKAVGFLLMALISLISASASVYTEWVMNRSAFKHESLNLQNMRLYSLGVLLNGAYYLQQSGAGQLQGFFADISAPHWAVVLILALMGLITGVMIKHYGNIVKVYASSIASLFAAFVSQVLLGDPPPLLFYAGVCLAMAATIQLQRTRTSSDGSGLGDSTPRQKGQQQQQLPSLVVPIGLAVLVLVCMPYMVLSLSRGRHQGLTGTPGDGPAVLNTTLPQLRPNLNDPASLVPSVSSTSTVDGPMPALPPFEPTCLVRFENRTQLGCLPLNCSLAQSCSIEDKACCAFYNFRMLKDLDQLLVKGLQGQYALVYGSALGAARNQSILGHTHDVDMAFTPTALQVLARNSTREDLWRRGYVLWHDRYLWRICPHDKHPLPEFRAAMVHNMTHAEYHARVNQTHTVYVDGYLMWPKPRELGSCADRSANRNEAAQAAMMMQPLAASASAAARAVHSPYDPDKLPLQSDGEGAEGGVLAAADDGGEFCLQQSTQSLIIKPGARNAVIGNTAFPAAHNLKEHLEHVYGPHWMIPNTSYHGVTRKAPDWWPIQEALLSRLSVTAWGDVAWESRRRRCNMLKKQAAAVAEGLGVVGEAGANSPVQGSSGLQDALQSILAHDGVSAAEQQDEEWEEEPQFHQHRRLL